ncbi:MAG: short chain dehydrogenase [Alphaproteobacteria bacterium]|nr:short chain dehydrogenase [Alphaproteobacteria bacterium]HCP00623.1 short chain dehydrogenase [Rhodospirillaceae bacterium]
MAERGGALITGAARRIGRRVAESLGDAGWHVIIHYNRSANEADAAVAAILAAGGRADAVEADLSDPAACARLIELAGRLSGGLTCLVNNASLFVEDTAHDVASKIFDRVMAVNLRAPAILSRLFANQVPDNAEGVIVNILDQKLSNPNPDFLSYTLSKHGLSALTQISAAAYGPSVRVCGVAPGLTLPSGSQPSAQFDAVHGRTPLARGSRPEDIADAVLYLAGARAVTGETILVDGGQHLVPSARDVMFVDPGASEEPPK